MGHFWLTLLQRCLDSHFSQRIDNVTQPFTGLVAYPITSLAHDGQPDLISFAHLVRNTAFAGLPGVTVLATSGAGVTFDRAERQSVV